MARRPARRPSTPPVELLRLIVGELLTDDTSRLPVRRHWDALDEHEQRHVITACDTERGTTAWQGWAVGNPQDERDHLLGAVVDTLIGHAGHWSAS